MPGAFCSSMDEDNASTLDRRLPVPSQAAPLGPRAATDSPSPVPTTAPDLAGRILLVEDEDDIRWAVSVALRQVGRQVLEASHTDDALRILDSQPIGLIISDLLMPGGGARSILAAMAQRGAKIPMVVVTGKLETAVAEELRAAGVSLCIQKPFELRHLVGVVDELIGTR